MLRNKQTIRENIEVLIKAGYSPRQAAIAAYRYANGRPVQALDSEVHDDEEADDGEGSDDHHEHERSKCGCC